jgi:hypothetical protein
VRLDAKFCPKCGKQVPPPVEIFISYTHEDGSLLKELIKHLSMMKRDGLVKLWYDRDIDAGDEWEQDITQHLNSARVILLLVSSSFVASDYCYGVEVGRAMERQGAGEAIVIPIILRPADWKTAPFGKLQGLPTDAKPVTKWSDRDEAFLNVAKGIRRRILQLQGVIS